jgi:glycosyltransferase involved in cell wall biosynthesis
MKIKNIRVSIIIPMYKDIVALRLILDALQYQTYKNFEAVIAEDDNVEATRQFLKSYRSNFAIKHFSQDDEGNRKATILNKVLSQLNSEYIIFIDGDTIPYSTFIESHIALSEPKNILCGRRVNLGDKVSQDLRTGKISAYEIEKKFIRKYFYLHRDNLRHYEQGLRFPFMQILYGIQKRKRKITHILGSNFSCFKDDIDRINGFDEDIAGGSKDDVDLEWRFLMSGCALKSCKFFANLLHLNHSRTSRIKDEEKAKKQMQKNQLQGKYICQNGIKKYD